MSDSRLHLYIIVGGVHLSQEIGINMRRYRHVALVARNAKASEIVHLGCIIILEINRIVDMSELVSIEKPQLKWKLMMKIDVGIQLNAFAAILIHW